MTARRTPSHPDGENGHSSLAAPLDGKAPDDGLDIAVGRARTREARRVEDILGSPDMVRGEELGILLSVTPQAIGKWRREGLILGLQGQTRTFRYPKWQIAGDGKLLPGLKEVVHELGDSWTVYWFLLQDHPGLKGKTALEALKVGQIDDVLDTARDIAQRTSS